MVKKRKAPVTKFAKDQQDIFVERIAECQSVIDHLETCPAWEVIQRDLERGKNLINDNWFLYPDGDPRLREDRITMLAYMHLLGLRENYKSDLENSKKELDKLQNTETKVVKDFDPN
jgi:hypothetical protein